MGLSTKARERQKALETAAPGRAQKATAGRATAAAGFQLGREWPGLVGLLLVTFLAFWPVLGANFLAWDDEETVAKNPWLLAPAGERVARFWSRPHMDLYIPVTYEAWSAVAAVAHRPGAPGAPLDPAPFHATNLALHGLAVLHVYLLLRRMAPPFAAAGGALLFGLHPVQVEPVAWVSGLKDVLSGTLALGALLAFPLERLAAAPDPAGPRAEPGGTGGMALRYAASTLLFTLALLAKPSALTVPLLLLALAWARRLLTRRLVLGVLPWCAVALACVIWTKNAQAPPLHPPLWFRPVIAAHALGTYLWKLVFPLRLGVDYGYSPGWLQAHPLAWAMGLLPLALGVWLYRWRERARWAAGGALLFVLALGPMLGLVPFDYQFYSTVSDRYLYLPLFGVAVAAAGALALVRGSAARALVGAVLLALGVRSAVQATAWHDTRTLFERTLAVNSRSTAALTNLATIALQLNRPRDAEAYARRSLAVEPHDTGAMTRLASALSLQGQRAAALELNRQAAAAAPDNAEVLVNLGIELAEQGQLGEATTHFARAVALAPDNQAAHLNYGTVLLQQRRFPEAQAELERAVRLDPGDAQARTNLAITFLRQGQVEPARRELGTALAIDPGYGPAAGVMRSLPPRGGTPPP